MSDAGPTIATDSAPPPPFHETSAGPPAAASLPKAIVRPARRPVLGWFWILPAVVLVIVILVVGMSQAKRGPRIVVHFKEGHGLKAGDAVRHRGITVGEARSVELLPDLKGVEVMIDLRPTAHAIAVENSRFWIVRLQADLTAVSGLDTVVGAKYVAVSPGAGAGKRRFVGDEAPIIEEEPGGLRIVVQDRRMGGLRPGAPLTYRGVRIGGVVSSGLASDASAVEVHLYVLPAYKQLVRTNSKFWSTSGFKLQVGWGVSLNAESAQTVLAGGMAMATPTKPEPTVSDGRRFSLEDKEPDGWQDWNPSIPLINANLPHGLPYPRLVRAVLKYNSRGRFFGTNSAERRGLLLSVEGNWLFGPADLLSEPVDAVTPPPIVLTFEGISQTIPAGKVTGSLCWVKSQSLPLKNPLPKDRLRAPRKLEDCRLVADSFSEDPPFVSESHLKESATGWTIGDTAPSAGLPREQWHGAAAVAVDDGKVIGLLLAPEKGPKRIVPLTEEQLRH